MGSTQIRFSCFLKPTGKFIVKTNVGDLELEHTKI